MKPYVQDEIVNTGITITNIISDLMNKDFTAVFGRLADHKKRQIISNVKRQFKDFDRSDMNRLASRLSKYPSGYSILFDCVFLTNNSNKIDYYRLDFGHF